ncbi:MAG: putative Ig domain-containing protein, partial [Candidatus Korobacteraceae bacterium]
MSFVVLMLASFFLFADPPAPVVTYLYPSSAVSGGPALEVAVTGRNFMGQSVVVWNGKQVPTTVISDSRLLATIEPGDISNPGMVQVAVVNMVASQMASNVILFTIEAAAPAIASVSPTSGLSSGGTPVTISGSNFVPGAAVRFGTLPASAVQYINSTTLIATSPASSISSVPISVTNPDGRSATLANAFQYQVPLTVTSFSLPAGATETNYSFTLAASGGTAPYTWTLKSGAFAPGLSLSTGGVISGTPAQAGTYQAEVQVSESGNLAQTATRALTLNISPPFKISSTTLAAAQLQVPYSATIVATGGIAPLSWTIVSGSLPAGLTLNPASGQISGTPYVQGTYRFSVRAADSSVPNRSDTREFTLQVGVAPEPLRISTSSLPSGVAGANYSAVLAGTGGTPPLQWAVSTGSLPPGVTLSATTGTLSGTPTTAGSYDFTVRVTDAAATAQSATANYTVTVAAAATSGPKPGENDTVVFQDDFESGTLSKWDAVDPRFAIEPAPGRVASGQYSVRGTVTPTLGYGELNKWYMPGYDQLYLKFKVMFEEGFRDPGGRLIAHMGNRIDNKWSASGKAGTKPNGTDFFVSMLTPEYPSLNSGMQNLHPFMVGSYYPGMTCSGTCTEEPFYQQVPRIATVPGRWHEVVFLLKANTPGASDGAQTVWIDGQKQIAIEGLRWRDTADVKLNQLAIPLYMPNASQTQHVWFDDVVVWSPAATSETPQTPPPTTPPPSDGGSSMLSISTGSLPSGTVEAAYSASLAASGGTGSYTWSVSVGSLPPGLKLSANGQISGMPTKTGVYSFTAVVSDSLSLAVRPLSMTVVAESLSLVTTSLPAALAQVPYSVALTAKGGIAPYSWSLLSGSLPSGVRLDSATGTLQGTPTASPASYSVEVQVRDSSGSVAKRTLSLVIVALSTLSITTSALPSATAGTGYSADLTATGGATPYTWSLASGALPPGLILGGVSGQISGSPSATGKYAFALQVTDGASQ